MAIVYLFLLLFFFGYGNYLRYNAPKQVGHFSGYRFGRAQQSQDHWDLAQKIFGQHLYRLAILTLAMIIFSRFGPTLSLTVQRIMLAIPVVVFLASLPLVAKQLPN